MSADPHQTAHRLGRLVQRGACVDEPFDASVERALPDFGDLEQVREPIEVEVGGVAAQVVERVEIAEQ